jgi:2-iminobutanoate/2-iminopropanoate deaminase
MLFVSGQIAIDPATGELVQGDIQAEAIQVMKNLEAVLAAGGSSFDQVVKSTIFLTDMNNFAAVNEIYGRYFDHAQAPARETVAVKALPRFVNVEISVVALIP